MNNDNCPDCKGTCEFNGDACRRCIDAEAEAVALKAAEIPDHKSASRLTGVF